MKEGKVKEIIGVVIDVDFAGQELPPITTPSKWSPKTVLGKSVSCSKCSSIWESTWCAAWLWILPTA
jgi:hypothetical protein